MAERLPPDDGDDLFEWTDAPARPQRPREREETGERERLEPAEPATSETGERGALRGDTGERRAVRGDTGERRRVGRGDTGEFERSGRQPPPGRRSRHRDLPARVRRRQATVIGAIALVLIVLFIAAVSGGGDDGDEEQPLAAERLIGQTIIAPLGKGAVEQGLVERARRGQVGGVIVEQGDGAVVRSTVQQLQQAAIDGGNPPLLVMIDQEGGQVKRIKDGPPDRSPSQLGAEGDSDAARDQGQATGEFLKGLGITVDLAPVLDVPQPQTDDEIAGRTFGDDPALVADLGTAFIEGLQGTGVAATAKHFPGLGRAQVSTDERPVSIAATSQDLEADVQPFEDAIEAGVEMVMVSTASYPTLGSNKPAAFSPAIVQGMLRDQLGFDGVVITDDLQAPGVESAPGVAGASAIRAGADLLLYAADQRGSTKALASLLRQLNAGELDRGIFEPAHERITALKEALSG